MKELDQKINTHFPGLVVRKDILRKHYVHRNEAGLVRCQRRPEIVLNLAV